jgi:hypothetical protein
MGYTDATLTVAVNAITALGDYISAHTGDPGTTGTNEVAGGTYARVDTTWPSGTAGSSTGTQVSINIPGGNTVSYWGVWSAVSAGTFIAGFALDDAEVFGSDGTIDFTPTLNVINQP